MATKGLEWSLTLQTLDRQQPDLIGSINIDAAFLNARETTHSWRSTPLGFITLSTNGKHMNIPCKNLLECLERTINKIPI